MATATPHSPKDAPPSRGGASGDGALAGAVPDSLPSSSREEERHEIESLIRASVVALTTGRPDELDALYANRMRAYLEKDVVGRFNFRLTCMEDIYEALERLEDATPEIHARYEGQKREEAATAISKIGRCLKAGLAAGSHINVSQRRWLKSTLGRPVGLAACRATGRRTPRRRPSSGRRARTHCASRGSPERPPRPDADESDLATRRLGGDA